MPSDIETLVAASRPPVRDVLLARPVLLWALFLLAITAVGILAKWLAPTLRPGRARVPSASCPGTPSSLCALQSDSRIVGPLAPRKPTARPLACDQRNWPPG